MDYLNQNTLFQYLSSYGYAFVFIGTLFEGELVLLAAGFFAYLGAMDFWVVLMIGFVGAIAGDNLWYWIGCKGGQGFINKYGKLFFLNKKSIQNAEKYFNNHGSKTIFISRFIFGTRVSTAILAGALRMPKKKFWSSNVAGAAIWAVITVVLGYIFGNSFEALKKHLHASEVSLLILGIVVIIILILRFLFRNKAA